MGQKSHPIGFRVWIYKSWTSEWIADSSTKSQSFFVEDIQARKMIEAFYKRSWIAKIVLRRNENAVEVLLFTWKVWLIMGKKGEKVQKIEKKLQQKFNKKYTISVKTIKTPETSARIMAEHIATKIEWRMPFRRVAKWALQQIMKKWVIGAKIQIKGRLWGVDIARTEKFSEGRIPLQTLRTDVDYYYEPSRTKYWVIWVKVWIAKENIYDKKNLHTTYQALAA